MDIKQRFGHAIKKRRLELGLSQEQLAEISSLHRTYISGIERGTRNISIENIGKISRALDISISTLFSLYGIEGK